MTFCISNSTWRGKCILNCPAILWSHLRAMVHRKKLWLLLDKGLISNSCHFHILVNCQRFNFPIISATQYALLPCWNMIGVHMLDSVCCNVTEWIACRGEVLSADSLSSSLILYAVLASDAKGLMQRIHKWDQPHIYHTVPQGYSATHTDFCAYILGTLCLHFGLSQSGFLPAPHQLSFATVLSHHIVGVDHQYQCHESLDFL